MLSCLVVLVCLWLSHPFSRLNFTLVRTPGRCRMKKQSELNGEAIEVVKRFGAKTQVRLKASNRILVVDTHGVRFEGARLCPLHVWCMYTMKLLDHNTLFVCEDGTRWDGLTDQEEAEHQKLMEEEMQHARMREGVCLCVCVLACGRPRFKRIFISLATWRARPGLSHADQISGEIVSLQAELLEEMALNDGIADDDDDAQKAIVGALAAGLACTHGLTELCVLNC